MKKSIFGILFVISAFTLSAQTYQVNKVSITQPDLMITTITLTSTETIVKLKYTASRDLKMGIYPPGHQMAFFLRNVSGTKKFQLLNYENIAIQPRNELVGEGQVKEFTLYFERVDCMKFHMVEGEILDPKSTTWHFSNIELK